MLYNEETWFKFSDKVQQDFKAKKYLHFDTPFDFAKKKNEIQKVLSDPSNVARHAFLPLLKFDIKFPRFKFDGKESLIDKLSAKERKSYYKLIYSFYSFALNERYQHYIKTIGIDQSILAYRTDLNGKCNIQFAKTIFDEIANRGPCVAIAMDIKGYFDSIDHLLLKEQWCKVIDRDRLPIDQYAIFKSLTKYQYVNKNNLLKHFKIDLKNTNKKKTILQLLELKIPGSTPTEKYNYLRQHSLIHKSESHSFDGGKKRFFGIPQGTSISAQLSNIFLLDFDKEIVNYCDNTNSKYWRYCDDLIVITEENKAEDTLAFVKAEIGKYFLEIQCAKTEIIQFKQNSKGRFRSYNYKKILQSDSKSKLADEQRYYKSLQYLGFSFNGKNITIRPGTLSRYFIKLKKRITKTVWMAYSDKSKSDKIHKQQLFHRYTHLGKRNFLSYMYRASKDNYKNQRGQLKEGLDSPAIRKQVKRHFSIMIEEIKKTSIKRAIHKAKKGKLKAIKL